MSERREEEEEEEKKKYTIKSRFEWNLGNSGRVLMLLLMFADVFSQTFRYF